jgi:hypothetical protein
MTSVQGSFDASQYAPRQGGEAHPIGMYPFTITNTQIVPTKDNTGGVFVVEFTSPNGSIANRYNIWNQSEKAVQIAHGQLSALCHAVGVIRVDWQNEGAALRGAKGQMKIDYQKGEEPTAERPTGGYVEIKKVYDVHGNEPGKAPTNHAPHEIHPHAPPQQNPSPQTGNGAPMQQNGNGGWGVTQQQVATQGQQAWPGPAPQQQSTQPNGAGPPWANK